MSRSADRARRAGRPAGCQGSAARGPDPPDHRTGAQPEQPRQLGAHRRRHVPRPVPRPRHDVRHDVAARRPDAAGARAQHPHAGARPRHGLRRRPDRKPPALRPRDRAKLRVEKRRPVRGPAARPRDGTAIIGDPRNDENLMIAGLQVAFLKFHNRIVDMLRDGRPRLGRAARERRLRRRAQLATWHYQWIIVNEFLPPIVGAAAGRRDPAPRPAVLPAARRRAEHAGRVPGRGVPLRAQPGPAVVPGQPRRRQRRRRSSGSSSTRPARARPIRSTCAAARRAPRRFIGWQTFFDFGGDQTHTSGPTRVIDTKISTPLFNLPLGAIASGDPPTSLPQRNLLRHLTWSIPSGQVDRQGDGHPAAVARQLQRARAVRRRPRAKHAALVLHPEGGRAGRRRAAGRCGARIVGEVFLGLLAADTRSYLHQSRWRPTLPSRAGTFRMVDC